MKNIEDVMFIIQARTQSTRVPNKMLRPFAGSSLIERSINKVLDSKVIPKENFFLYVCDQELIDLANQYGINTWVRSENSTKEPITLKELFEWHVTPDYKYYCIISACCPLLKTETIDRFVTEFLESDAHGLFPVFEKKHFIFDKNRLMLNTFLGEHDHLVTFETKLLEPYYETAGTMYAGEMRDVANNIYMGKFEGDPDDPQFFIMDEFECLDIDYPWQFKLAEELCKDE